MADLGGLCVLSADRYLNRRLEMHLRGRAGRPGNAGESKLFTSFEDEANIWIVGADQAARNSRMTKNARMVKGPLTWAFDRGQRNWAEAAAESIRPSL